MFALHKRYCNVEQSRDISKLRTTNNIGILFSTVSYNAISNPYLSNIPINNFAHVYESSIITDSINWVTISGEFIADSAYTCLNIANFFDANNTDTIAYSYNNTLINCAYYYIDDVCVSSEPGICYIIGSAEGYNSSIKIYPNPASKYVQIESQKLIVESYEVFNIYGKKLKQYEIYNSKFIIQIEDLPNGIYLLKLTTAKESYIKKIIKT